MSTAANPATHAHAASLESCLDLINTIELTDGVPHDHIPAAEQVIGFILERGLAHEGDLRRQQRREGDAWVARVREARASLRELWDAQVEGRAPTSGALVTLNAVLDHAPRAVLRATEAGVEITYDHPDDDPTGEALARLALPLVEAIASGQTNRFRICANDGCRWVFEDSSRAGRRRWCDMATCGNRAKVRRFRSRQREGPTDR